MNNLLFLSQNGILQDPTGLKMIITSLSLGIIVASIAMLYRQLFLGGIVRKIIEKKADSKENAVTVEQMGYNPNNIFIKFALRKKSTFRKTVYSTETFPERYYIPEKIMMREEIKFRKNGNNAMGIVIAVLVFAAVTLIAINAVPWFIDALKDIIS